MFHNFERVIESYDEEKANELTALINSACEALKISVPEIWFHDHVAVRLDEIMGCDSFCGKDYEREVSQFGFSPALGAHGLDSDGNSVIMVGLRDNEKRLLPLSHVLFSTVHELRHSWQLRYGYYKNFKEEEIIDMHTYLTNPLEMDADAFGAMFMEQCTKYRPHLTISYLRRRFDKKRIKRMKELRKEYFPYVPKSSKVA